MKCHKNRAENHSHVVVLIHLLFSFYLLLKGFEEAGDFLSMVSSRKGDLIKLFGKGVQSNKISKDDTDQNPYKETKTRKRTLNTARPFTLDIRPF